MNASATTWRFPRAFWTANLVELCERAAYYGSFIILTVYLSRVVGMDDVTANSVGAVYGATIYLLPFFTGALADRMGFRRALILAFALLTCGYGMLGAFDTALPVLGGLLLIVLGGSFVKPIITGTVAKSSDATNRARAYSLFYMTVNIGAFLGKTVVKSVRQDLGVANVPWFSAGAALVGLIFVALLYHPDRNAVRIQAPPIAETLAGMWRAIKRVRFLALILITAGFWAIQGQLYAAMPKYVLRLVGEGAAPEWYANINPFVVVIFVVPVTHLVRRWRPEAAIAVAMMMIPFSALAMSLSPLLGGNVTILGIVLHPITVMMIVGISIQGLAECFLSPKYLEYASQQAPAGEEGLYLGFAHMNTFFAWLFGFGLSGYLLKMFCPDPRTLGPAAHQQWEAALAGQGPMPEAYAHAHFLWYTWAVVGGLSFLALLAYVMITRRLDARAEQRQG